MSDPWQIGSRLLAVKKEIIQGEDVSVTKEIPLMNPLLPQSVEWFQSEKSSGPLQISQDESQLLSVEKKAFSGVHAPLNEKVLKMEQLMHQPTEHVCLENEKVQGVQSSEAAELEEDKIDYLSGKPFFDVVLSYTQLKQLQLPRRISRELPFATVPTVLTYGGKNWNVTYRGETGSCRRFENAGWQAFVNDNNLKYGNACVFELMENSSKKIRFKVFILRSWLPPELQMKFESCGTASNPIAID